MLNIKELGEGQVFYIEPGDSTCYTLLIADIGDEIFVAIGAGVGVIEGGYSINRYNLHILPDMDFVRYWQSHTKIKNEWTASVAVLAAYLYLRGELVQGSTFIHDCYRNGWS